MYNTPVREAYNTLDRVMEEVTLDEQASLENICLRLKQENETIKSPAIDKVIDILKLWGKKPAAEIKDLTLKI